MKIHTLIVSITLIGAITSCQGPCAKDDEYIGDWNVQWITYPDKGMEMDPNINLTMNGKMIIRDDCTVTIHAYGYEGCIFQSDTLENTLNWEVSGDTLNLLNEGDEFGIPYVVKEVSENKMKLQLVQDIFLFLSK